MFGSIKQFTCLLPREATRIVQYWQNLDQTVSRLAAPLEAPCAQLWNR